MRCGLTSLLHQKHFYTITAGGEKCSPRIIAGFGKASDLHAVCQADRVRQTLSQMFWERLTQTPLHAKSGLIQESAAMTQHEKVPSANASEPTEQQTSFTSPLWKKINSV